MRTGIFGGTFNPVHYGHLRAAEETREALHLDRVVFIPCSLPPHKEAAGLAGPGARLKMLEAAVEDNPYFEISDIELKRGGKSYSIDTLRQLVGERAEGGKTFFIIGMDSFVEIGIWKDYGNLFRVTDFAVVARPGYMEGKDPVELLPVDIRHHFCYDAVSKKLLHRSGHVVHFLETTLIDISSTKIRECISGGRSVRYLLPPAVEKFIRKKGLYGGEK